MGIHIRPIRKIAERAATAAELAVNRQDGTPDDYVDPALLEEVYAGAIEDFATWLVEGGKPTDALLLVLRAGRTAGDDLPDDHPVLGYPPLPHQHIVEA